MCLKPCYITVRTKTSRALPNLHLALMKCLSVHLSHLFNPWFAKKGLEWVQFPVQNTSARVLIAWTASVTKPQRFALAVGRMTALVGRAVDAPGTPWWVPRLPEVTPLHRHSPAVPGSSFCARAGMSSACCPPSAWGQSPCALRKHKERWIMAVQTEGDLVLPQRGSAASAIRSVTLGMWNGWEIIFHLYCQVSQNMS